MQGVLIGAACTVACKATIPCLRLPDLQDSVAKHIHTYFTYYVYAFIYSAAQNIINTMLNEFCFCISQRKVLVISQVTRVLDNFNKLPWPETKPAQTRWHTEAARVTAAVGLSVLCAGFSHTFALTIFNFANCLTHHTPASMPVQVSRHERNNGNCATLSSQSTRTHTQTNSWLSVSLWGLLCWFCRS